MKYTVAISRESYETDPTKVIELAQSQKVGEGIAKRHGLETEYDNEDRSLITLFLSTHSLTKAIAMARDLLEAGVKDFVGDLEISEEDERTGVSRELSLPSFLIEHEQGGRS